MAEASASPKTSKKHGPLTAVGWAAVAGGVVISYILLKRYEADKAATNAATSTAADAGSESPEPIDEANPNAPTSQTSQPVSFSTVQGWIAAMLPIMSPPGGGGGYDTAAAYNDVTSWINGNCVTAAGYSAISTAITQVGLPPGFDPGPLSVCSSSTPTTQAPATAPTAPAAPAAPAAPTPWANVVGSADSALASLNPKSFADQINFGQWSVGPGGGGTNMTQVGTIENGAYSGADILNGAPAYVSAFGAVVQNFNPKSFANGTPVYVPTTLVNQGYVKGVGQPTGPT